MTQKTLTRSANDEVDNVACFLFRWAPESLGEVKRWLAIVGKTAHLEKSEEELSGDETMRDKASGEKARNASETDCQTTQL